MSSGSIRMSSQDAGRAVKPDGISLCRVSDDSAREALTDMPPRLEEELDAVTLHNQAIMNMEDKVIHIAQPGHRSLPSRAFLETIFEISFNEA